MKRSISPKGLWILAAAALLGACSDSTTAPTVPTGQSNVATSVEATTSSTQTATAGTAVLVAPAVRVKDASGQPLAGVTVQFRIADGGGTVQYGTVVTDAQGNASSGRWTLGSTAGYNELQAVVGSLTPLPFTATGTAPQPPSSAYNIKILYIGAATARQQQSVTNAIARWQSIITQDLSNIPLSSPANSCFSGQPAVNETVDDILIFVDFDSIDGPNKTLGEAGPCYIRNDNQLPIMGHLKLDRADLTLMERSGTMDDVVLHEIGHILGIGTLWTTKNLILGEGGPDPQFVGAYGNTAYHNMGPSGNAPIENTGEVGTRDGHWRESTFDNELMTGWINSGRPNPISALTIASLQDLGYGANPGAASSYTLNGISSSLAGLDLGQHEKVLRPKWKVDRSGKHFNTPFNRD